MQLRNIETLCWGIAICAGALICFAECLYLFRTEILPETEVSFEKRQLPRSSFALSDEAYTKITSTILNLNFVVPRMHLPDLQHSMIYFGCNGRPDAHYEQPKLHFGFQGHKNVISTEPGEKVFLTFDKKLPSPCKYMFSDQNQETLIWFTSEKLANEVQITLVMKNELSEEQRTFTLQEKEPLRTTSQGPWELGKWRVDGTILARQKARWMGMDLFLEKFGGDEFASAAGKHRIDFIESESSYSVFVKAGEYLIWEENRWKETQGRTDTADMPLLYIKKIEDRVMMCELWDVGGKGKLGLNLIRTPEPFSANSVTNDFRFLGARTKTQVVLQVNQSRMLIKPDDWFILTSDGWHKVVSSDEVDDYVSRKMVGPLFVFEEIVKKEDRMVLLGTIFNPSRTEMYPIEVAMMPSGGASVDHETAHELRELPKPGIATPFAIH